MRKIFTVAIILIFGKIVAQPAGWLYNLPIQVQNSNTVNAVNYQLKITVNTQSLIAAGQMLANGNDIRFSGGCTSNTFYNYWIEGGLNTATTAIWVKIPLIAANTSSTVFMFYGNTSATAQSAINGTFRGPNSATDSVSGGTSGGLLVCQRGFRFSPLQNMLVTHFGKNEPTGSTRYVTLFNYSTQAILSQTQVSGPSATYSYGPIANPIWLTQGTQYVLQIYGIASDGYYYQSSSQIGQHLQYYDMQYSNGGTQNTFPSSTLANYHYGYGDFWYYITNTLTTIPSYTLGASNVAITSASNAICSGATVTLSTNASGTYTWSNGSTAPSIVVNPATTTTYSVAQTGTSGCTSNAYFTLNVSSGQPTLSVSSSTNQTCLGKTATLTASGALTYTWTNGVVNGVSFTPTVTNTYTVSGQNGCGISTAVTTISVAPLPISLVVSPTIVCAGQQAVINAASAATSYTWLPINQTGATSSLMVSPLVNSTYTVAATDGTCSGIATISLATNPNPTVSIVASASTACQGDPVTMSASGGLSYTWTPGNLSTPNITVNPTAPTAYSVGATNSFGCSSGAVAVVITVPSPTVNASASSNLICAGESATLQASGATTYTWNNGSTSTSIIDTPTASTVYTVTGTTNNCSNTQTINVDVFTPAITISGNTVICDGATASLVASGATNYTWMPNTTFPGITVSPNATTIYTLTTETATGNITCASVNTIQVTVNPNPTVIAVASRTAMCKFENVTLTASGAATYSWNPSATGASVIITSSLVTTLNYVVIGTSSNNCSSSATVQIKVNGCVGLGENTSNPSEIRVFPNPNSGNFTISYHSDLVLDIVNELGQVVKTLTLNSSNNYSATLTDFAKGIYFVVGQNGNSVINHKMVVE